MGNFHVKTQNSTDFAHTFSKPTVFFLYFLIKIILFYTKNLFIRPKNCVQIIFYNEKCKKFCKNQFFRNIFTFLSVIRHKFEYNLRILANFRNFQVKTQKSMDFAHTFSKNYSFFFFVSFNKDYTFYNINLFIRPKNCVQSIFYNERYKNFRKNQFFSNIFTFLSVTRQNFEYNLRILVNFGKFSRKNSKIYGFRPYVFKKLHFFVFFNKDYTFYNINLFMRPKNCVQSIFYKKRCKMFCENQFFSKIFTFLSITLQNFEYNLRILANFGKFSRENSKIYGFRPYVLKKPVFFVYFNEDYIFYTKNLFIRPQNWFQSIFYNKRCKKFRKNQFFSNIFTFLSITRQNFQNNLRILVNIEKFSRKNLKIYGFRQYVLKNYSFFCIF